MIHNSSPKSDRLLGETSISITNDDGYSATGTYTIDYFQKPIVLDITADQGDRKERYFMEFLDKNTFRIVGGWDKDDPRLKSFDTEDPKYIVICRRK